MSAPDWNGHAARALAEDRAQHDITTALLGSIRVQPAVGVFRAECDFVVAGLPIVEAVFTQLEQSAAVECLIQEGATAGQGARLAVVRAPGGTLLAGERVALNYLHRLSAIATATRRATEAVAGTDCVITDTRKTTPGLRDLEKYAVRVGGGVNHRQSLEDAVLWKDNHWGLLRGSGDLASALRGAPENVAVCVEVENRRQLEQALGAGVTWVLADNQTPETIREWVALAGADVTVEASGGITPESARCYADAGARRLSLGCLTASPEPISLTFDIEAPSPASN